MRFLENWERCQTRGLPHPAPFNAQAPYILPGSLLAIILAPPPARGH